MAKLHFLLLLLLLFVFLLPLDAEAEAAASGNSAHEGHGWNKGGADALQKVAEQDDHKRKPQIAREEGWVMARRMDVQINDYPPYGANNRHTPHP